ncbi:hypothetical protein FBULB1_4634 [Fusarium bulbicola]|nr:hypothetical protein FBULB1_4634 [Fusarium bulbicola]
MGLPSDERQSSKQPHNNSTTITQAILQAILRALTQRYRNTCQDNQIKTLRLKDFKSKKEIDEEIDAVKFDIETAEKDLDSDELVLMLESANRLCARCIVNSGPGEYSDAQIAMAQQQCDEYEHNDMCALHRKGSREGELKKLKAKKKKLEKARDSWTGAD